MNIKNIKALLKVQMKMGLRGMIQAAGGGRSKLGVLLWPLLLIAFVPVVIFMVGAWFAVWAAGAAIGQGHLVLVMALTAGQLAALMFGIFYVISAFYFANDLKHLVPLPLRPGEILLSKFIGILVNEYATLGIMVLPALIIYGIFTDVAWTYFPFAIAIFLLLPVLPLVIASLFSIVLMRVTNLRRNRDLWRVVGALFGVSIGLGFQFFGRYLGGGPGRVNPEQALQQILASQQDLITGIGKWFPTSLWATDALREGAPAGGVVGFALFSVVALAGLFFLIWVAERLFFGGLLGGEESRSTGRVFTNDELTRATGQTRSPLMALLVREIKLLNRTPSFLMAGVLPMVMVPIFLVVSLFQQGKDVSVLVARLSRVAHSPLVPVLGIGAVLFMNALSNIPATAISREGRHFWISRSLPVSPRVQIQAKILHSLIFTALNIVVVLGGLGFVKLLTPLTGIYVVAGGLLTSIATGYGGMSIDLMRPNLTWTDPQQAMKGNLNVLFGMLGTMALGLIMGGAAVVLYIWARPVMLPAVILILGGLAYLFSRVAGALAEKQYLEYEG